MNCREVLQTYFVSDQPQIERLTGSVKQLCEIEDVSLMIETPIVRIEDIATMKSRKKSITYENQIYRGSISSKENVASLADKHEMALCRPEYVVNGLTASLQITRGYNQSIKQYIEKGYMRKSQEQEHSKSGSNLPQIPVIMPVKDSTETRIVIDTSTKMDGLSLNGAMHNRPNLNGACLMSCCVSACLL